MGRLLWIVPALGSLFWLVPAFVALLQELEAAHADTPGSDRCGAGLRECLRGRMPRLRALDKDKLENSLIECARSGTSMVESTVTTLQHSLLVAVDDVAQSYQQCAEQADDAARGSCLNETIRDAVSTLTDDMSKRIGAEMYQLRRDVGHRLVQCVEDAAQAATGEARLAARDIEACVGAD